MRLESFGWCGVAGFGEERVAFPGPLSVILGGNGTGKTALLWMLRRTICGTAAGDLYPIDSSEAWGELRFRFENRRFALRRDFLSDRVRLIEEGADGVPRALAGDDPESAAACDAVWTSVLGPGGWDLLLSAGLDSPDGDAPAIERIARTGETTGGPWAEDPAEGLVAELASLRGMPGEPGEAPLAPGTVDLLREELEARIADVTEWDSRWQRLSELLNRRDALEDKLAEARSSAQAREETYTTFRRFHEAVQERIAAEQKRKELHARRDEVKKAVEAVESAQRDLEDRYGEFLNAGVDLEETLERWSEATTRLHDAQRRSHLARQALANAPRTYTARNGSIAAAVLGGLGFLAAFGAGALTFGLVLGPLLGIVGFGAVWAKDRSVESMKRMRREELAALDVEADEARAAIEAAQAGMGTLGKLGHPVAIRRTIAQYWKARDDVEALRRRRDELPRLTDIMEACEEALQQKNVLDAEVRDLVARAPYLAGRDASPASLSGEVDMARAQWEASQARADRLERDDREMGEEIDRLRNGTAAPGRLEAEVDELRERLAFQEQRALALETAVEVMRAVRDEYRTDRAGRLTRRAGEILGDLTAGEVDRIRFSSEGRLEAATPDGAWRAAEAFGRATREQIAFAVRLAALQEARAGRKLPLVLDEPFAAWDEPRRAAMGQVLREHAAQGGQVLILSHREEFARWSGVAERLDGKRAFAVRRAA